MSPAGRMDAFSSTTGLRPPSARCSLAAVLLEKAPIFIAFFLCHAWSQTPLFSYRWPQTWLSVMEALAAVSLAGNLLQFLEFSGKLIKQAKKYHSSISGLRKHIEIEDSIDALGSLLEKLQYTPVPSGSDGKKVGLDIDPELVRKAEACILVGSEIKAALYKVQSQGKTNWRTSFRKAFRSIMSEEYLNALQRRLSTVQQDLQLHLSIEQREQLQNIQAGQSDLLSRLDSVALSIYHNVVHGQEDLLHVQQEYMSQEFRALQQQNVQMSKKIDTLKATLGEPTTRLVLSPGHSALPSPAPTGRDLFKAIRDERFEVIPEMIQQGANVNYASDKDESRPIHLAVKQGSNDVIDLLLQNGADIECYSGQGLTPLMLAARYGNLSTANRLVELGCNLNAKLIACRPGVTTGIDLDNVTTWDSTALTLAAQNGHVAVVRELLSCGAAVDPPSNHRFTPLHAAVQNGHPACVEALLEAGADVDSITDQGFTPLIYAANVNQKESARMLLKHGANADAKKSHGMTAILEAIWMRNSSMVDLLAGGGADLEITTGICGDLHTPLQMAADWGNAKIVATLLKHGANQDHKLRNGMTAEQNARKRCDEDIVKVFEEYRSSSES